MAHQIGEYKLVGDMVWRRLGYTKSDISIPICRIYGETDAIRVRIFKNLFADKTYSPLAHASVEPVDQAHPKAPEVLGYDVREGVSKGKIGNYST